MISRETLLENNLPHRPAYRTLKRW